MSQSIDGSQPEQWTCTLCTFLNDAHLYICSVCGLRKASSSRRTRYNDQIVAQQMQTEIIHNVGKSMDPIEPFPKRKRSKLKFDSEDNGEVEETKINFLVTADGTPLKFPSFFDNIDEPVNLNIECNGIEIKFNKFFDDSQILKLNLQNFVTEENPDDLVNSKEKVDLSTNIETDCPMEVTNDQQNDTEDFNEESTQILENQSEIGEDTTIITENDETGSIKNKTIDEIIKIPVEESIGKIDQSPPNIATIETQANSNENSKIEDDAAINEVTASPKQTRKLTKSKEFKSTRQQAVKRVLNVSSKRKIDKKRHDNRKSSRLVSIEKSKKKK